MPIIYSDVLCDNFRSIRLPKSDKPIIKTTDNNNDADEIYQLQLAKYIDINDSAESYIQQQKALIEALENQLKRVELDRNDILNRSIGQIEAKIISLQNNQLDPKPKAKSGIKKKVALNDVSGQVPNCIITSSTAPSRWK